MQWYKDGKPLPEESTMLFLREVNTEDRGNYTCKAENVGGYDKDDIYITVYGKYTLLLVHFCIIKSPNVAAKKRKNVMCTRNTTPFKKNE